MDRRHKIERLDDLFEPWNRSDSPGLAIGVAYNGDPFYRRGFGLASLESGTTITPTTKMRIASVSKHFTSLLALLLAEEQKLDLDRPIRTFVQELTGPSGDPTLRQLMQHRGGSRCHIDLGFITRGLATPPKGAALEVLIRQKGRNFAPGEAMIYNNGGYHLLSIAIERAGGAEFAAQLKTRLFDPLGMLDTSLVQSDYEITPGMATMHVPIPGQKGWYRGLFCSEENLGEGGIVSTIDDMLRWADHFRRRDKFGSPESWAELTEPPAIGSADVSYYALGLMVQLYRGLRTVQHSGSVFGGSSQFLTFPEHGLDVVILINGAREASAVKLGNKIADIMLEDQLGQETPTVSVSDYTHLIGNWWSQQTNMIYTLNEENGALTMSFGAPPPGMPLVRLSDGRVVAPATGIGEIQIDVDQAADGGELDIHFGGTRARYRKGLNRDADCAAFASAAIGNYHCEDANCTGSIYQGPAGLVLSVGDKYGFFDAVIHPLNEVAATTVAISPRDLLAPMITLEVQSDRATGFQLNTPRTRGLGFVRV